MSEPEGHRDATLIFRGQWDDEVRAGWIAAGRPRVSFIPGATDDLDWVPESGITRLIVVGVVGDDSGIERATDLEELELSTSCTARLDLSNLVGLRRLSAPDRCDGLDATALEWLHLSDYASEDLGGLPIAQLRLLRVMPARRLRRIDALAKGVNLHHIGLGWTRVDDWSVLAACQRLRELELVSCPGLRNLNVVAALPELMSIELDGCRNLTSLRPLAAASKLQYVAIRGQTGVVDGHLEFLLDLPSIRLVAVERMPRGSDLSPARLRAWRAQQFDQGEAFANTYDARA